MPVFLPAWTSSNGYEALDAVLPELFLEPNILLLTDINADDDMSDVSVEPDLYEELTPPHLNCVHCSILHSTPSGDSMDPTIFLQNPLAIFYLCPDSNATRSQPANQLIQYIQMEHCKGCATVLKGGLLVVKLSSQRPSEIVNVPYEHFKYIELIIALYVGLLSVIFTILLILLQILPSRRQSGLNSPFPQ